MSTLNAPHVEAAFVLLIMDKVGNRMGNCFDCNCTDGYTRPLKVFDVVKFKIIDARNNYWKNKQMIV